MEGCPASAPPGPLLDVRAQNPGKADWAITEVYAYGAGLRSLLSVVGLVQFCNLKFLSLHGNQIDRIEGLDALRGLIELNLSSNNISKMGGLSELTALKVLNLSSNRLTEIAGLQALTALTKLVLSHNRIVLLGGLSALHGPRFSLQHLDIRDNLVCSLSELWVLAGCMHLQELILATGKHQNPVCQTVDYQRSVIAALPNLQSLDGHSLPPKMQRGGEACSIETPVISTISYFPQDLCLKGPLLDQQPKDYHQVGPSVPFVCQAQSEPSLHPYLSQKMSQGNALNPQLQPPATQESPNLAQYTFNQVELSRQQNFSGIANQSQPQRSMWSPAESGMPAHQLTNQPQVSWKDQPFGPGRGSQQNQLSETSYGPSNMETQIRPDWHALQGQWMPTNSCRSGGKDSGWFPMSQFHHVLNGFHRRKQYQQSFLLDSLEDEQASAVHTEAANERIGMLEARVNDLIQQLTKSRMRGSRDVSSRRVARHEPIRMDNFSGKADRTEHIRKNHIVSIQRSSEEPDDCSARRRSNSCFELTGENCLGRKKAVDLRGDKSRRGLVCEYEWIGAKVDSSTQTNLQNEPGLYRICQEVDQLKSDLASMVSGRAQERVGHSDFDMVSLEQMGLAPDNRMRERQLGGATDRFDVERVRMQLADNEKNSTIAELQKKLEEKGGEVERLREGISCMEEERSRLHQSGTAVQQKLTAELLSAKEELASRKQDLRVAQENVEKAVKDWTNLKESADAKTKAFDEEHASLKIAEKELEVCRLKEAAARKEIKHLLARVDASRLERQKQLERLKASYEEQCKERIAQEVSAAEARAKAAADKSLSSVKDHLQAKLYNVENELRQALQDKTSTCQKMKDMQEKTSKESLELKQALKALLLKERRAEALVGELSGVVQSQKVKLQSAHQDLKGMPSAQEELRVLREEVNALRLRASKSEDLARELEGLKCQVAEASLLAQTEGDNVLKERKAQLLSLKDENNRLASEAAACQEKLQAAEDAVRIKSKMLESQNESIRELKSELKEAYRETKIIADSVDAKWHDRMRDDIEQGLALRKELAAQEKLVYEVEKQLKLEKAASKAAEQANCALQRKISEKDSMLRYVEEEIARVKGLYECREKALAAERDHLAEQLKLLTKEKEDAVIKAVAEVKVQQKELSELNQAFENRERQMTAAIAIKDEQISQFSQKLVDMEKELHKHIQAKQKLKMLSNTKVNQLCKVLEELREAT